jgi:hypothetical protein
MGVVTTNGQGFANPVATQAVKAIFASAHQKAIISTIPVNNGDSVGSQYNIGNVPTSAVLDPASLAYASGIAGLTNVSVGFGASPLPANRDTWVAQPAALVNAQDWHTAASFSLVQAVSEANYGKQVWQLLGLTEDPGGNVPVFATVGNATTAAGTLQFILKYFDDK